MFFILFPTCFLMFSCIMSWEISYPNKKAVISVSFEQRALYFGFRDGLTEQRLFNETSYEASIDMATKSTVICKSSV